MKKMREEENMQVKKKKVKKRGNYWINDWHQKSTFKVGKCLSDSLLKFNYICFSSHHDNIWCIISLSGDGGWSRTGKRGPSSDSEAFLPDQFIQVSPMRARLSMPDQTVISQMCAPLGLTFGWFTWRNRLSCLGRFDMQNASSMKSGHPSQAPDLVSAINAGTD